MCFANDNRQNRALQSDWTIGGQTTEGRRILYDGELDFRAAQQTVLRLLEGQETCNGEMNNTHKICKKSHLGMSKLGWIIMEWQNEYLYLCDIIFIVQISKVCVFSSSLQVPPHITHRATSFCVLKFFEKFVLFVRRHFQLICDTCHAAAAVRG